MLNATHARAPAKINLVLEVLGRREDGYHEVDTILQTLHFGDTITWRRGSGPTVDLTDLTGPYEGRTPEDDTNLAVRAANELARLTGLVQEHHIAMVKRIPPASGLGGGASDAAAILRLLQRVHPEITDDHLLAAASAVGSDPPFFLSGATARARGRGELVEPLPSLPEHGVVLFVPPLTLERKTARLFAELDKLPFDDGSMAAALAAHPPWYIRGADIYNAFERVAFDVFPGLASLWEDLETRIEEPIHLAGAGPTLFWIGPVDEASSAAARAEGLPCTTILTRTSPSLWRR